jgi:hypothetical protein
MTLFPLILVILASSTGFVSRCNTSLACLFASHDRTCTRPPDAFVSRLLVPKAEKRERLRQSDHSGVAHPSICARFDHIRLESDQPLAAQKLFLLATHQLRF